MQPFIQIRQHFFKMATSEPSIQKAPYNKATMGGVIGLGLVFGVVCEDLGANASSALIGLLAIGTAAGACAMGASIRGSFALQCAFVPILGFGLAFVFC